MKLGDFLNIHGLFEPRQQDLTVEVKGLTQDSRQVKPGFVYLAIKGHSSDGHQFITNAIQSGAIAVVVEDLSAVPLPYTGAVLQVLDSRLSLQVLAQRFYSSPGEQMKSMAVTGTNGKTSSAYIFEFLSQSQAWPCGVMGTIDHHLGSRVWSTNLTTPDPITLQKRLQDFRDAGAEVFVMEASSHALEQKRIQQGFDVCLFTNLTRDHLDYHHTMESYLQSKAKLFSPALCKEGVDNFAVLNIDDPVFAELEAASTPHRVVLTYGQSPQADFSFRIVQSDLLGVEIEIVGPKGMVSVHSPLLGLHNVYNFVGVLACVYALGGDMDRALKQWPHFTGVPGRLQRLSSQETRPIHCFVDYAHTPDALDQVLQTLKRQLPQGSDLICLFGCGGDRDRGKRPEMASVAAKWSDQVWVTSDNPRSEDPQSILEEIKSGFPVGTLFHQEVDRSEAIRQAIAQAKPGDVILVAGKGHEKTQTIGAQVLPFDDVSEVSKVLSLRGQ